jgi:hypothetical protein
MDSSFTRPGADAAGGRRESGAAPPRWWRTWLLERPLPTADAPHDAIGVYTEPALAERLEHAQTVMTLRREGDHP